MKKDIRFGFLLAFAIVPILIACKPEQHYSPQELKAMQDYACEWVTFLMKDTTGLHQIVDHYDPDKYIVDRLYLKNDSNEIETFNVQVKLFWSVHNSRDRYDVTIIDGINIIVLYAGKHQLISMHASVICEDGQPMVDYLSFTIQRYVNVIHLRHLSISLEKDTIELVSTKEDKSRGIFKKHVGPIAIYDNVNGKKWTIAE